MIEAILFLLSTAGFEFTGIPANAREAALANTSLPSPFFKSLASNPAGILGKKGMLFNINYIAYLAGTQYGSLAHLNSGEDFGYGAALFYFTSGDIKEMDERGNPKGNFSFSSFSLSCPVARRLIGPISVASLPPEGTVASLPPEVAVGGSPKFLFSNCDTLRSAGIAFDIGVLFSIARVQVGLLLKNLGFQFGPFYKKKDRFPTAFRTDAGYLIFENLLINFGLEKFAAEPFNFNFGAEWSIRNFLFIRGSYSSLKDDLKTGVGSDIYANFALGLSVQKTPLRLDYSFSPFPNLGNCHYFSLFFLR